MGGGDHDWAYLLGELGWLHRDRAIGNAVYAVGVVLFLISIGWAFVKAASRPKEVEP